MAEPPPTYTRAEMDAILKRAIERQQARAEGIDHEDLVAAAGEVGIPRDEVEAAARDIQAEKAAQGSAGAEAGTARAAAAIPANDEDRALAVARFRSRAVLFSLLSVLFFYLGQVVTHDTWWVWPIFGFALSLGIQANRLFFADPQREKARARKPTRDERRQRRREERREDFERTVAFGADAIVKLIEEARKVKARLDDQSAAHRHEPERPAPGPRVIVTPPPANPPGGVRVETREGDVVDREDGGDESARKRGA